MKKEFEIIKEAISIPSSNTEEPLIYLEGLCEGLMFGVITDHSVIELTEETYPLK